MFRYLHPRWVALHLFVLACCVGCIYAGKWQWDVARRHGDLQNYAYAVQWNIFVLFGLGLWVKVIKDAQDRFTGRERPGGTVNQHPDGDMVQAATYRGYAMPQSAAITVEDPELARYNAYLNALAVHSAESPLAEQPPEAGQRRPIGRTDVTETAAAVNTRRDAGALLRYRIMAYTTGVMLLLCCVVALPLEYGFGVKSVWILWMLHGYLFIVYIITALHLGLIRRWQLPKLALVAVAGTIPLAVFFVERWITAEKPV